MKRSTAAKALISAFATIIGIGTASMASAQTAYGSSAYLTMRKCNGIASTQDCLGTTNPDISIKESIYAGGVSSTTNATFTPTNGGVAKSNISFGALDLPIIKGGAWAGADNRVNSNSIGYQSFTYTGTTGAAFSLTAAFDYYSSGAPGKIAAGPVGSNEFAGEGNGFVRIHIMDAAYLPTFTTAQDIANYGFTSACGDAGVLGEATVSLASLTSGYNSGTLTLNTACGGGALSLTSGMSFVTTMLLQTPSNRLGYFDATNTVTLRLGDDLSNQQKADLTQGLISAVQAAVPEPATWAMMIGGFGLIGASMRRRAHTGTAIA